MATASFFDWSGWEFFVAAGTILLALATYLLARGTTRETQANWRPVLAIEPWWDEQPPAPAVRWLEGRFLLAVHNIGRGPAIDIDASLSVEDGGLLVGRTTSEVLAPDGRLILRWDGVDAPTGGESVFVSIHYFDVSYTQYETFAEIGVEWTPDDEPAAGLARQTFERTGARGIYERSSLARGYVQAGVGRVRYLLRQRRARG